MPIPLLRQPILQAVRFRENAVQNAIDHNLLQLRRVTWRLLWWLEALRSSLEALFGGWRISVVSPAAGSSLEAISGWKLAGSSLQRLRFLEALQRLEALRKLSQAVGGSLLALWRPGLSGISLWLLDASGSFLVARGFLEGLSSG